MSGVRFASGRVRTVSPSLRYTTPIGLPVSGYKGAVVAGEDNIMYYSDGTRWVGIAPVLSALIDAGNAQTVYEGGAAIDLGSAQT